MPDNDQRRRNTRFPVKQPVAAAANGRQLHGVTRDVNAEGLFFLTETPLEEGSTVEVLLTLPPGTIFSDQVTLRAKGKAVRIERSETGSVGVAVAFEQIQISHSLAKGSGVTVS